MAMTDTEQKLYADIVNVVNRTENDIEFKYDSKTYVVPARGKKSVPRFIAEHGVNMNAIRYDNSGFCVESLLGIEGDPLFITTPLSTQDVNMAQEADKFGDEVDDGGEIVKKKKINLKPIQENFSVNNL